MARGNCIIVSANPRGVFMEGFIAAGQTPKPGTWMQVDPTVALKSGRHTFKIYAPGADGEHPLGALYILREDPMRPITTAYAAGDRAFLYTPVAGEELNCLVKNLTGTADDHAAGEKMMIDDSSGMLIATTGSPESEAAVLNETITDPTSDTLAWIYYTGY
jgi:hypothetical protein